MDGDAFDRVVARVMAEFGGVDIVVNNLGQARPFDLDTTEEEWDEAFRLNFDDPAAAHDARSSRGCGSGASVASCV